MPIDGEEVTEQEFGQLATETMPTEGNVHHYESEPARVAIKTRGRGRSNTHQVSAAQ